MCPTGLNVDERAALQTLLSQHGGRYTPDLGNDCTHLVAVKAQGDKFEYARKVGIPIVTMAWVHESVRRGGTAG